MKKILAGAALVLVILAGAAPAVHAEPAKTVVTGTITKDGNPVEGTEVEVDCEGFIQHDTTDAGGGYLVEYTPTQCPVGVQLWVKALNGSMSGSGTTDVKSKTTKLNVAIMNLAIPEYGLMGGIVAAGAGVGAIAFTRRRYAKDHETVA